MRAAGCGASPSNTRASPGHASVGREGATMLGLGRPLRPVRFIAPAFLSGSEWARAGLCRPCLAKSFSARKGSAGRTKAAVENGGGGPLDGGHKIAANLIESELHVEANRSYLAYALSVIVGRAIPDARDGLKPVHRRILFAMDELGLDHSKPYRKCARVVGEVLGKFHPHGDVAVYDALVRLAQSFTMRHRLIQGHGNFGSQDDDPPAAMRYTECRLSHLAGDVLLRDLDKGTVDFVDNFDMSQKEPSVLPAKVPNLLICGAQGIAVGMATNIPTHNVSEVVAGLVAYIDDPDISLQKLMRHIPAPDFATGGIIISQASSLKQVYDKGSGRVTVRGRAHFESLGKKRNSPEAIVITELPFQVVKAKLIEQIADLVDSGKLGGISDVRDESDRDGMRVVVEVARHKSPEIVLNNLYHQTRLEQRVNCNFSAIVGGQPKVLGLMDVLRHFVEFRVDVVERRAKHDLRVARAREHIVEAYLKSQARIGDVVKMIRGAESSAQARRTLEDELGLTEKQAAAVLSMPLGSLARLEAGKLEREHAGLQDTITGLAAVLSDRTRVLALIREEALEVAKRHGDGRRTDIERDLGTEMTVKDLIPNEPTIVVVSHRGYVKRMTPSDFLAQNRRTKGRRVGKLAGDDEISQVLHVHTHDTLLCFSSNGRVFRIEGHDVPLTGRGALGVPLPRILKGWGENHVTAVLPVASFGDEDFLLLLTKKGQIKRTKLAAFEQVNRNGKCAMRLAEGDEVGWVRRARAGEHVLLVSRQGRGIRIAIDDANVRPMHPYSKGTRSMKMKEGDSLASMGIIPESDRGMDALLVTSEGTAKRVALNKFTSQARGGSGVIAIKLKGSDLLSGVLITSKGDDEFLVATQGGNMNRYRIGDLPRSGRTSQGVKLISVADGDRVQSIATVTDLDVDGSET